MNDAAVAFLQEFAREALIWGETLLRIAIIVVVAWVVSWVARRQIEPMLTRRSFGRNGALLVGRILSIAAFVGAFLAILGILGASWTGLLAVLSAFTVAIGLSLQDVMKNFFAGILLLVERPFLAGDRVKVKDVEGEIQGIDIRTTLIRNKDGALVLVPNSLMFTEILTNRSHFRTRRLDLSITSVSMPIDQIERRIAGSLADLAGVRKPIPAPHVRSSSTEGTRMNISLLIEATPEVEQNVMRVLIAQLGDSEIEIKE